MQFPIAFSAIVLAMSPWTYAHPYNQESSFYSALKRSIPTTVIAGVTVPNTPIVQAAQAYARAHNDDFTFNHIMRSWLYGAIIVDKNATLKNKIDPEVLAVAAILHDLGWDPNPNSSIISPDKRFEVDGAIAARNFINEAVANGTATDWDAARVQLVWDAIALHATPSIADFKEPAVHYTSLGIFSDFAGPNAQGTTLDWEEYNRVKEVFPRLDVAQNVTRIICNIVRTKPNTTFDNWMMPFGFRYVEGYPEETRGQLTVDAVANALPN